MTAILVVAALMAALPLLAGLGAVNALAIGPRKLATLGAVAASVTAVSGSPGVDVGPRKMTQPGGGATVDMGLRR